MAWYKFWKKSGPTQGLDEKYVWLDDKIYSKEESVKGACEYWADRMPGGHNTYFKYGYNPVPHPPQNVLEKMIERAEIDLKSQKKQVKFLKETLNKATKK